MISIKNNNYLAFHVILCDDLFTSQFRFSSTIFYSKIAIFEQVHTYIFYFYFLTKHNLCFLFLQNNLHQASSKRDIYTVAILFLFHKQKFSNFSILKYINSFFKDRKFLFAKSVLEFANFWRHFSGMLSLIIMPIHKSLLIYV